MKKYSHLSSSHKGTQPIRVLQHNVLYHFENANATFLNDMIDTVFSKGLQRGIGYYTSEYPIMQKVFGHYQTPFVDINNKIYIHETFASYVWCISYSIFVLYDEAVAKPSQNMFFGKEVNIINHPLIERTQELFNYAISLIKVFSPWDKEYFPNPEEYSEDEKFCIERGNSLFVYAMTFILCHEYAHVEKEHLKKMSKGYNTPQAKILFEKDADARAIELMLHGATKATYKSICGGILVGLCCMLFFRKETISTTHPDTDDRIDEFMKQLNLDPTDPLWGMATLAYRLWDNQFAKCYEWPNEVNDFKEMYEFVKNEIAKEK